MGATVTLDRFAELQAEIEAGRMRDEVLAGAGLSVDEWTSAQREWLDRMGSELTMGSFELTNRYAQRFLSHQAAMRAPRPAAHAPVPPTPASLVSSASPAPAPTPTRELPSFLAAQAAQAASAISIAVKKPASPLAGTSMGFVAPKGPALPFARSASPPAPAALAVPPPSPKPSGAAPVVKTAPAALTGTSMAFVAPKAPALPFNGGAPAAEPKPPPAMPVVNRAPAALVGTSMAFEAPKGPALPFANYGGQVAADPAKPVHGALADSAARPRPEGPRETTKGATPGAAPATTTPSAIPAAMKGPPAALTGTSMAATPTKGAPTPFTPRRARPTTATVELPAPVLPAPPAPVELTLEQYASLQVELARAQADVPAILARYRIGAEQRAALDAHWTARLAASVGMQTAFDAARAAYEAWLLASPRS